MKNILMLICDQLSAAALSAYGNTYSHTPNIDRISNGGMVFEHAYCACPLCQPSRASFWTSRYPHQTGILSNLPDQGFPALPSHIPTLGEHFSNNGYTCVHFGKTHDYGGLRGFDVIESKEIKIDRTNPAIPFDYETYLDIDTTQKAVSYLKAQARGRENPLLMAVDLQNPHNICAYIGEHRDGFGEFPLEGELPPLPDNYQFDDIDNRPPMIQYLCCAHRRQRQVCTWSEEDFRHYLYAYYYYLSMVDRQIGEILDALEESGLADDTLIVFTADHGEGMAAHQLVTKYGAFYEETNHVPLFFKGPSLPQDVRIGGVSSLLDLFPTLSDYAGLPGISKLEGQTLLPQLLGASDKTSAPYVCAQWFDEFCGYTVPGRMICDTLFKYTCYLEENSEEPFDMQNDPLETRNLAYCDEYDSILQHYRNLLNDHISRTKDPFFSLKTIGTENYRHHPVGRKFHQGLSAVELYAENLKRK